MVYDQAFLSREVEASEQLRATPGQWQLHTASLAPVALQDSQQIKQPCMTDWACKHAKVIVTRHRGAELSAKLAVSVSIVASHGANISVQCIAASTATPATLHMP